MGTEKTEKTVTGLPKNTAAALSYVLGPLSGIVFMLVEKDPFIRFHAAQSIVVFGIAFVLQVLISSLPIFWSVSSLIAIVVFALWLVLIYKAWQGDEWEVPVLGKYARQLVKKAKV